MEDFYQFHQLQQYNENSKQLLRNKNFQLISDFVKIMPVLIL